MDCVIVFSEFVPISTFSAENLFMKRSSSKLVSMFDCTPMTSARLDLKSQACELATSPQSGISFKGPLDLDSS